MDFDRLPREILPLILQHLPFKQRILVSRVNRQFKEATKSVISQTKTFNLTAPIFRRIPVESMKELIEECADSLEKMICVIDFWDMTDREYKMMIRQRLRFVLGVSFPRLSAMALDVRCCDTDCYKLIRAFLVKNTNLRAFEWNCFNHNFLDEVDFLVFEKLERIELQSCHSDTILSFSNYFTDLKHLIVDNLYAGSNENLNVAFGKWPSLLTLEIRGIEGFSFEKIDNLWQLASLRRLVIGSRNNISDEILQKISTIFPQLTHLEFCLQSNRVTNEGMKRLESMKNLRRVKIQCSYSKDSDILELIGCKCLHVVQFDKSVSPMTVVCFALRCPNLRQLIVPSICGVVTRKSASLLVSSLDGFIQEKLSIIIPYGRMIWNSSEVESALENINSMGRRLSIEVRPAKANDHLEWGDWGCHSDQSVRVQTQVQLPPLPPPSNNRWYRMIDRWHVMIDRIRARWR